MAKTKIKDFGGGLNLQEPSTIDDNQFEELLNMFYDADGRLRSRNGLGLFGNPIPGNKPPTSWFFYKNPTTGLKTTLVSSGEDIFLYDESTSNWSSIRSGLSEFEADGVTRTRWSFAVYLGNIYLCNGVDDYAEYNPETNTYTKLGQSSVGLATFDNTTDIITITGHGLTDGESIKFQGGTVPTGINEGKYYYVISSTTNTLQISLTYGGSAVDFTDNGTGPTNGITSTQPRVRYLAFLGDSIYGAGEDANPSLLYATDAAALDGRTLNANEVLVGGEESGRINGLEELQQSTLAFKDKKVYTIPGDLSSALPLDSENGGYGDKAIQRVGNSLLYFNDRGFNTLKSKSGITGTEAIQDEPLSDDVRALTSQVKVKHYNDTIGKYVLPLTNYYGMFNTGDNDKPDTTLIYSSLKKKWSQYNWPSMYDFGEYEDDDGNIHYIGLSATSGQVFELETGFDDLGLPIEYRIGSKRYDLGDPTQWDTYSGVDLIGLKSLGDPIDVSLEIDGVNVGGSTITDDYIVNKTSSVITIGTSPIGVLPTGGGAITNEGIKLFRYKIRVPLLESGSNIKFILTAKSDSLAFTLDQANLHHEGEDTDLFEFNNIG